MNALYDAGITMNDVNPDYVVVGEGRSYSLDTLTKATNLVWKGAKLIGANSDVSGPIENGIVPACRALVAPIEMATGTQAYFCGKPNPLMMRTGLRMLHCHSAEAVMVGDRMDTDVISGMESGMSTVLVLGKVSTRETIKTYAYRPSMVLNGVGDIVEPARVGKDGRLKIEAPPRQQRRLLYYGDALVFLPCTQACGWTRSAAKADRACFLVLGPASLVDRAHDGGLFVLVGDDVIISFFVGKADAEEFFSARAARALGVQHRAAARARGARRVHDKVGIAFV